MKRKRDHFNTGDEKMMNACVAEIIVEDKVNT
jgi:hypothetical protein